MSEKPDKIYPYKPPAKPLVFGQMPEMPWKNKDHQPDNSGCEDPEEEPPNKEENFWMVVRKALLLIVHAIECENDIEPKTAVLRKEKKRSIIKQD